MRYHLGVDVGGTFTDAVLLDDSGGARTFKTPTTPEDASLGVTEAVRLAAEAVGLSTDALLSQTAYFGLGTTAATNALLERTGATTGLLTTRGFRDGLLIQRTKGQWAGLGDDVTHYSRRRPPEPIVPRRLIEEVTERVDYEGRVVVTLDEDDARAAIDRLLEAEVAAIAVSLLWSFRNPAHEHRLRDLIREAAPEMFVSLSCELVPVIGEYERTATTAINAYLGPVVRSYVGALEKSMADRGLGGALRIMDSGGGVITAGDAATQPVSIITSGPTGGVLASQQLAEALGERNVITTDMGGTSFDASLIVDGRPLIATQSEVGQYHIVKPMINVTAIGAGGGSIARVEDGALRVGPRSAGARPGPACYGRGGSEATITDADVVLGILDPDNFLGGRLRLDRTLAEAAIRTRVAEPLGMSVEAAASAIKTVADHQMADLLHALTIGKGYDPRDFVVFAYGGAGPTHCHAYGFELGVRAVIVPATATAHSAYGAVASDLHRSFGRSDLMRTPPFVPNPAEFLDPARVTTILDELDQQARESMRAAGVADDAIVLERFIDIRYRYQVNELMVPVPAGKLDRPDIEDLVVRFDRKYEELFGKGAAFREAGIELVTFRVAAHGRFPKPALRPHENGGSTGAARRGERPVHFGPGADPLTTTVYRGEALAAGSEIPGPAIVEYPGTTVVIGPGQSGWIDRWLNVVIESKGTQP